MYNQTPTIMSAVTNASVSTTKPRMDGNYPALARGYPTGSSSGGFSYLGTSTDSNKNVWIVLQATANMATTSRTADNAGEVFDPSASGGLYCSICIGQVSNQNWTVRARTSKDGSGGGVTYSAGTGGGPGGA